MMPHRLLPVGLFALLAFTFSWSINQFVPPITWLSIDVKEIMTGFGPALAGLVCYSVFSMPNVLGLSLIGNKPVVTLSVTLLSTLVPVIVMTHQTGAVAALGFVMAQFVYTLGEELGWRYYLQNAVAGFTKWQQALIIGVIWFFWHYAILNDPTSMLTGKPVPFYVGIPLFITLLVLLSKLLGDVVMRTQALLLPTVLHYVGKASNGYILLTFYVLIVGLYLIWNKARFKMLLSR